MRRIEDLCDRSFDAVTFGYFFGELRGIAAMKEKAATEMRGLLELLKRELGDRSFFCGELSLADLVPFVSSNCARHWGGAGRFSAAGRLAGADARHSRGKS